jgi:hypothetical protein
MLDNANLARLAQRLLAGLSQSREALIDVDTYRDAPDFEALSAIEQSYVPGTAPPSPPQGSWLSFVFCKPALEGGRLRVHVLEPSTPEAARAPELWLKLKRAEALRELMPEASVVDDVAARLNRAIVDWARAQVEEPSCEIVCESDRAIENGPTWLRTPLELLSTGDRIAVRAPITQTPLDLPPRFAGMHYVKLISPSWALSTLSTPAR